MRNIYTIISGIVEYEDQKCPIPFALIFQQDGLIYIETFFSDDKFYDKTKGLSYHRIVGITEKGYDIECEGLFCTKYYYEKCKVVFICNGFIKLINNKKREQIDNSEGTETPIYLVELEGMNMHFADYTKTEQFRNSRKIENLIDFEFDHTDYSFIINIPGFIGNHHKVVLIKNPENENILIDFSHREGYTNISYDKYTALRNDLVSFLSFINGNNIRVRKEFFGEFLTIKGANKGYDSHTVKIYSFKNKVIAYHNNYLPINEHHSYTSQVFTKIFITGFDKFYHLNKKLDFSSLILSLNSTNSVDLDEKYFILITALERISRNYGKFNPDKSSFLIDESYFNNFIKPEFNQLLKNHKSEIEKRYKTAFSIFSSKIGNLNKRNNLETTQKIYELLNYANIKISNSVITMVELERHQAVHEGIIGHDDKERVKNYWKLDHILRDIILNLIDYKGIRNRKYDYEKD